MHFIAAYVSNCISREGHQRADQYLGIMSYITSALSSVYEPLSTAFILFGPVAGILFFEDVKMRAWLPSLYRPTTRMYSAVILINVLLSAVILILLGGGKFASNRSKLDKVRLTLLKIL